MKRKIKLRNPYARAILEDKKYRPKKVISKKYKGEKHKLTVQKALSEDDE